MKEIITDSIRYWEPRRVVYNAALALVLAGSFAWHRPSLTIGLGSHGWQPVLGLFLAAVTANVLYCSAYLPDVLFQSSQYQQLWKQWRWALLVIGTVFAAALFVFYA